LDKIALRFGADLADSDKNLLFSNWPGGIQIYLRSPSWRTKTKHKRRSDWCQGWKFLDSPSKNSI